MPADAAHMAVKKPRNRKTAWAKFFAFVVGLFSGLILTGFFFFVRTVTTQSYPEVIPQADGIVVLTGKGGGRLDAGADLLRNGHGERLLISGVNRNVTREDVLNILALPEDLSACCVDLDFAVDTIENAKETAIWAEALAFDHIILVTSAYHMPRAQVEITAARGRMRITPYPVSQAYTKNWWKQKSQIKRLVQEYGKLLFSYARRPSDIHTRNPLSLETQRSSLNAGEPELGDIQKTSIQKELHPKNLDTSKNQPGDDGHD